MRNCGESERHELSVLLIDVKERIRRLARAEALRKKSKLKRKNLNNFMKNPYGFANKLFEQSKSGELTASQAEVEAHLEKVYGNKSEVNTDIAGL